MADYEALNTLLRDVWAESLVDVATNMSPLYEAFGLGDLAKGIDPDLLMDIGL